MCQLSAIQVSLGPAPTREAQDPCLVPTSGLKKLGNDKTYWHKTGFDDKPNWLKPLEGVVARGRIELPTHGFSVRCSTD